MNNNINNNLNYEKDNNVNLNILNKINKAAKMGMDSISYVMQKVNDKNMKENLSTQFSEYGKLVTKVNDLYKKYGEIPDETPLRNKIMSWTGVQLNTISNNSNSKIAEMMVQGGTMGIIECQKLLNHNPNTNQDIKNVLNEFMTMQKNDIEKMKTFL